MWLRRNAVIYHVVNVSKFVREHEELFEPQDVIWDLENGYVCRAVKRLNSLGGNGKDVRTHWKNWELVRLTCTAAL